MALGTTGITTSKVGNALGTNSRDVGTLCSSNLINPWSRWKPISVKADTLTDSILKAQNYGISVLSANTPASLLTKVQNNGNLGYTYNKPVGGSNSPYRLGDYRGYNHNASLPIESAYKDGDKEHINGVSSDWSKTLMGVEMAEPDILEDTDYLTKAHIYPDGLTRGALVKNSSYSYWSVGSIPWGNTYWQRFKGSECQVFEFLTNLSDGTTSVTHTASSSDLFYSLPEPLHTISVTNTQPAGSKDVFIDLSGFGGTISFTDTLFGSVTYNFRFSSIGDVYAGGTLKNVYVGLYRDASCTDVIIQKKLADSITVGSEETSREYFGTLTNTGNKMNVYFGVYWNYKVGYKTIPMQQVMEQ